MIVYLIRHAEYSRPRGITEGEAALQHLTSLGQVQAGATAKSLKKLGIQRIYSSPMVRAQETALVLQKYLNVQVEIDERLREFITDTSLRDGHILGVLKKQARTDPERIFPSGESLNLGITRLENFLLSLNNLPYKIVGVVSHRVIIEGLLSRWFNVRSSEHEWLRAASVTAIEITDNRRRLIFFDRRPVDFYLRIAIIKRWIQFTFQKKK